MQCFDITKEENQIKIKQIVKGYLQNHKKILSSLQKLDSIPSLQEQKMTQYTIIMAGRLVPEKGYNFMIPAMSLLIEKGMCVKLEIYGEGPLSSEINSSIQKFNLSNFYLINSIWLNSLKENMFDIIVSNPPYVAPFDPHLEELKHEPILALVAEQNGLRDFDLISSQAIKVLKDDGLLAFEHGNNQANEVRNIMINYGFKNIILINDFQLQPRITIGKK